MKKNKTKRDPKGRFSRKDEAFYGTYTDDKGYIRICAGPFRGMRLHTLVAIAMNRKHLKDDQDVHHRKGDKLNPCPLCSLEVLGHKEHGWVSRAQHLFMLRKEIEDRKEWEELHGEKMIGSWVAVTTASPITNFFPARNVLNRGKPVKRKHDMKNL